MTQTTTIDETQAEIEALRAALVGLAHFVGGDPCWCQCGGGKHSEACRAAYKLPLWRARRRALACRGKIATIGESRRRRIDHDY